MWGLGAPGFYHPQRCKFFVCRSMCGVSTELLRSCPENDYEDIDFGLKNF